MSSTSVSFPCLRMVLREASASGNVEELAQSVSSPDVGGIHQGGIFNFVVGSLGPRALSTSLVGQLRGLNPNTPSSFTIAFNVLRAQIILLKRRIRFMEIAYKHVWDINKRLGHDYNDLMKECNAVRKNYHDNKIIHKQESMEYGRKIISLESDNRLLKLHIDALKVENERKSKKIAAQKDKLDESSILFESMVDIKIYGSVLRNAIGIFDWEGKAEDALIRAIVEASAEDHSPWSRIINGVIDRRYPNIYLQKSEEVSGEVLSEPVESHVQNMVTGNSYRAEVSGAEEASTTLKTQRLNKTGTVKLSAQGSSQNPRSIVYHQSSGIARASISHRRSASIQRNEEASTVKTPKVFLQPKVSPPAPALAPKLVCNTSLPVSAPGISLPRQARPVSPPRTKRAASPLLPSSIASPKISCPSKNASGPVPPMPQPSRNKHTPTPSITSPIRSRLATSMTNSYKKPVLKSIDLNRSQAHNRSDSVKKKVNKPVVEPTIEEDIPKTSTPKSRGKRNGMVMADKVDLGFEVTQEGVLSSASLPGSVSEEVVFNNLTPASSSHTSKVSPTSKAVARITEYFSNSDLGSLEESSDGDSDSESLCSRLREIRKMDKEEDKKTFTRMKHMFAQKLAKPATDSVPESSSSAGSSIVTKESPEVNRAVPPAPVVVNVPPSYPRPVIPVRTSTPARPLFQLSTSKVSPRDTALTSSDDTSGMTASTSGSSYSTSTTSDAGSIMTSVKPPPEAAVTTSAEISVKPVKTKLGFFDGLGRRFARIGTVSPITPLKKEISGVDSTPTGKLTFPRSPPRTTSVSKVVSPTKSPIGGAIPLLPQPNLLALRQKPSVSSTERKREPLISPRAAPKPSNPSSGGLPISKPASSIPTPLMSSRRSTLLPPLSKLPITRPQLAPPLPSPTMDGSVTGKSFTGGPGPKFNVPAPANSKSAYRSTSSQSVKAGPSTATVTPPISIPPSTKLRSQTNHVPLPPSSLSLQVRPYAGNAFFQGSRNRAVQVHA